MDYSPTINKTTDIHIGRLFFSLLKPRVMSLVVFTGFVGYMLAPGQLHPILAVLVIIAIGMGAGGAGCLNMWYERDLDAQMKRTRNRPIVAGHIEPDAALTFGVMVSALSFVIMGLASNWLAAALLVFANFFYVFIYTMLLKRHTPQNIVIGGLAGAMPPLIGWVAAAGHFDQVPLLMVALIFMWTPPHFWALSLNSSEDYKNANIPMMPLVHGVRHTKNLMVVYSILSAIIAIGLGFDPILGNIYLGFAIISSLIFVGLTLLVWWGESAKNNKILFFYSIFYLFGLFCVMLLEQL